MKENTPTRRTFLAAAAAAALPGCRRVTVPASPPVPGFIDAHSHVWSPDIAKFPLGPWAKPEEMDPRSFTAEELLAVAEPCGVSRVVLIQHAPYYGGDNAYLIDSAKRHPGRFSLVAIVDERRIDLAEHLRSLKANGVRGLRIGPNRYADRTMVKEPDRWLEAPAMRNLWTLATDLDLVVCPLINAGHVPTLEPMLEMFPRTKVALDHFAHCEKPTEMQGLLKLARFPNVHIKASGFYKFGPKKAPYDSLAPMIRAVVEGFGPQRVLWGSDCPYQLQPGHNYRDAVALIERGLDFLDAPARTAILRGNAERLFFT